jgi:hypothetical protein
MRFSLSSVAISVRLECFHEVLLPVMRLMSARQPAMALASGAMANGLPPLRHTWLLQRCAPAYSHQGPSGEFAEHHQLACPLLLPLTQWVGHVIHGPVGPVEVQRSLPPASSLVMSPNIERIIHAAEYLSAVMSAQRYERTAAHPWVRRRTASWSPLAVPRRLHTPHRARHH